MSPFQAARWQVYQAREFSRLSWAATRQIDCCTLPPGSESLCRGLNWAESHIPSRWYQHTTISSLCAWAASSKQKASGVQIPRTGETVSSLWLPGPSSQVNWRSCHLSKLQQKSFGIQFFITFYYSPWWSLWIECRCQMFDFLYLHTSKYGLEIPNTAHRKKKKSFHGFLLISKKYLI